MIMNATLLFGEPEFERVLNAPFGVDVILRDGDRVYLASTGGEFCAFNIQDETFTEVINLSTTVRSMLQDAHHIYCRTGVSDSVKLIRKEDYVLSSLAIPRSLDNVIYRNIDAVFGNMIYFWERRQSDPQPLYVRKYDISTSISSEFISSGNSLNGPRVNSEKMLVNNGFLYWTDIGLSGSIRNFRLVKANLLTGAMERITLVSSASFNDVSTCFLREDDESIYVISKERGIYRISKSSFTIIASVPLYSSSVYSLLGVDPYSNYIYILQSKKLNLYNKNNFIIENSFDINLGLPAATIIPAEFSERKIFVFGDSQGSRRVFIFKK